MNQKAIVPDTGVLIDGRISELVEKEWAGGHQVKIIVSYSVIAELEYQANSGREIGVAGLAELKKLSELAKTGTVTLEFAGERPSAFEIERARFGEIDSKIRSLAKAFSATLLTTDKVQRQVAEAEGIDVIYLEPMKEPVQLSLAKFFEHPGVLSVHIKEGLPAKAKIGRPGEFGLKEITDKKFSSKEISAMVREAVEYSKRVPRSFIELDKEGATVIQAGEYRIVFTKPPFSEAPELTIVRPLVHMKLSDYEISPKLRKRLEETAEGMIVAGPPGSGKSTFVTAMADYYSSMNKIVKTLEQPRDLQVGPEVTQYAPLEGSFEEATDILLLVRPDYTIFDEVRKPQHFTTFADLRMSGVGMLGVVHAAKAIDALQRFLGKIDLGIIPQIIDTIIFIEKGRPSKTYVLSFIVRTPTGMREQDLARPVIEVRDLETNALEYELYKWGEETVVFPVAGSRQQPLTQRFDRAPSRDKFSGKKRFAGKRKRR